MKRVKRLLLLAALVSGCTVGPDYVRPTLEVPTAYKESKDWKPAEPRDAAAGGPWWAAFADPELDSLMGHLDVSNQTIAAAEAQVRVAAALADQSRAQWWPTVDATASSTVSQPSTATGPVIGTSSGRHTIDNLGVSASWEADLWGRIRRLVESGDAATQASAGDLANARLSVQATLAVDFYQVRALDTQSQLLASTVAEYERNVTLTRNRYAVGVASRGDVAQAETQLHNTRAQLIDLGIQRAQLEHAIAVLLGRPAATYSVPPGELTATLPPIPATGLPADLLERRPDVAAAERRVAAANAQIGVARAAYFPVATLGAQAGYQAWTTSLWFTQAASYWAVGPALALTLFDGGRRSAVSAQASAEYDQAVAAYRGTVLQAFAEVEDNLAALRILQAEAAAQDEAVRAAQLSVDISLNQYKAGTIAYQQVVVVQAVFLQARTAALTIRMRRIAGTVQLVKALGGDWTPASE
ncbi:MAG: efflux transporter outer membrane subunit [Burkholderiales bacterium]